MNCPKVSIIILNWNGLEDTIECLESFKKVTYTNYEIIVVDNGSEGNDAQVLREKFAGYIRLVQNDSNLGCSKGFNAGTIYALENSRPDYIMIMNNDMVVAPDFIDELVRVAESNEQIGIVGPKIYYYDYNGRKDVIWSAGGKLRWWSIKLFRIIGLGDDDLPRYQAMMDVDWIIGALIMFKLRLTEEIGLLDPWYFFTEVDVEYCLRARKHGFKIVYVPTARVWHKVGVSARKAHLNYANLSSYYHVIRQCFPLYVYLLHLLLLPILLSHWTILYLIRRRNILILRSFLFDFVRFILRRPRQSL